jgi:hypothetical protein
MNADCSAGNGKFKDLDGEAVAYANSYFYVAGSHGCSRNSFKFHPSAFLLVRLPVDETGHKAGEPQATYRIDRGWGLFFHRGRASLSRFETVANDRR